MAAYHPRKIPPRQRSPPIASSSASYQNNDLLFPSAASTELGWSLVYPQTRQPVSNSFSSFTSDTSLCKPSPRAETCGLPPPVPVAPSASFYWHDLGLPAHDGHGNFPSPGITPRASVDGHLGFHRPEAFHRSLSSRTADTYSTIASTDDGLSALDLNDGSEYGWEGLESVRNRSEGGSFGGGGGLGAETGIGTGQTPGFTDRWRLHGEKRRRDSSPFTMVSGSTALSEEGEEQERGREHGGEREQGGFHHHYHHYHHLHSRRLTSTDSTSPLYQRHLTFPSRASTVNDIKSGATSSSSSTRNSMTELLTTPLSSLFQLASSSILSFLPPTKLSYKHSVSLRIIRSICNIDEDTLILIFPPPSPPPVEQPAFHQLFLKPISATTANSLEVDRVSVAEGTDVEVETVFKMSPKDDQTDDNNRRPDETWTRGRDLIFGTPWIP